jgi:hypothetical protein
MSGGWLSSLRNKVNYQQEFGAWFPYAGMTKSKADELFDSGRLRINDPMKIALVSRGGNDQIRIMHTCAFIISLARVLIVDMADRHPENKSFHNYGAMAFLNLANH